MARRVLVVDDEENIRVVLRTLLRRNGYEVEVAGDMVEALQKAKEIDPDVVLTDVRMPRGSGLDLLAALREQGSVATVIVMSAFGNVDLALEAIKAGAYDFVHKPFRAEEVVLALRKAEEREALRRENQALKQEMKKDQSFGTLLAQSDKMKALFKTIAKIADFRTTVLISGESGVGKELVARAIHDRSGRKGHFVAVNCGAIPETLLESELFGHKRGAFTDATADKRGLFEEADAGTLFLDEIGELPLSLQVKLLRVLQGETIRRLGDTRDIKVDTRIVAATHRDLAADVKTGRFREDLYYRLHVLPLAVPPLRARPEDITLLLDHFIQRNNLRLGTAIRGVQPETRRLLLEYAWPGNVRELENTVERAMVLCEGEMLSSTDLPDRIREAEDPIQKQLASNELSIKKATRIVEEVLIRRALQHTRGNRTRAAEVLEISHRALLYKLKEYLITDL